MNYARVISLSLLFIPVMLTLVAWFMGVQYEQLRALKGSAEPEPSFDLTWALFGLLGVAEAALAPLVMGWVARRSARDWAEAGHRGDEVALDRAAAEPTRLLGLDIGANTPALTTLWEKFMVQSLIGPALSVLSVTQGFVLSIMSQRVWAIAPFVLVSLVFWAITYPRRATWDGWAASAGLSLPWEDGPHAHHVGSTRGPA